MPQEPNTERGRQNVVLELGFFLGKLGRSRVVILYEDDVGLPSDPSRNSLCRARRSWSLAQRRSR
ncbi:MULTISPECIES: TIR domain-containing protein [Lentzea]|uniref:TIR domain-containing protein n=1 Tax=Lentzea TaxID=165301 RepID=UPI001B869593